MKVYLVRHGETQGNIEGAFYGVTETPLSPRGKVQGQEAKEKLSAISFDHVLVSPLSRAVDTARLAGFEDVSLLEGLKEMDFGIFEGLTFDAIKSQYPKEVDRWTARKHDYVFPEGESLKTFYDRVIGVYQEILATYEGERILIVAHSGVLRAIFAHEISENFDHYWKYKVDNASVSIIAYEDNFTLLEKFNT